MGILVQLILNGLIAGAIYALVALGFNLIYSTTKFFNLAYGALAAVGGYGVFFFSRQLGWNVWIAILISILLAGFLGWLTDKLVFEKLRNKKSSSTVLLVASLGVFVMIQAALAILFTSQFQTLSVGDSFKTYEISCPVVMRSICFGASGIITQNQLAIMALVVFVSLGLFFFLKKTLLGRMIQAISDDEEAATVIGIPVSRVLGYVFFIASALAGLAGIMIGYETGIEPTMGMSLLLKGVIATIIGGIGNVFGGILGALFLGIIENLAVWQISAEWKDAIAFSLLIIFLLLKPSGIFKKL